MTEAPPFFVPAATADNQESVYEGFAKWCHCNVPPMGQRIYSITLVHDGEEWIATVGQQLSGSTIADPRSRAKVRRFSRPVSDPALVLAIFPGNPYMVVTNHRLAGNVGSRWENPFMAGIPTSITYFQRAT